LEKEEKKEEKEKSQTPHSTHTTLPQSYKVKNLHSQAAIKKIPQNYKVKNLHSQVAIKKIIKTIPSPFEIEMAKLADTFEFTYSEGLTLSNNEDDSLETKPFSIPNYPLDTNDEIDLDFQPYQHSKLWHQIMSPHENLNQYTPAKRQAKGPPGDNTDSFNPTQKPKLDQKIKKKKKKKRKKKLN